jgi:heme/copper-type cytochrome/quinol oxidase subunit 3
MLPGGMKHFAVVGLFGLAVIGGGIVWLLVARRRGRGGA